MRDVTIRDLRNHGGEAELVPLPSEHLDGSSLLSRWRTLPPMDVAAFRTDIDRVLDASL